MEATEHRGVEIRHLLQKDVLIFDYETGSFYQFDLPVGYDDIVVKWNGKRFAWIVDGWPEEKKQGKLNHGVVRGRCSLQQLLMEGVIFFDPRNGLFYHNELPIGFEFAAVKMITKFTAVVVSGWPCTPFNELLLYDVALEEAFHTTEEEIECFSFRNNQRYALCEDKFENGRAPEPSTPHRRYV